MAEEPERRRVLLADDHPGMHPALARLLMPWCEIVGSVYDGGALLEAVSRLRPDIVVLDVRMPGVQGIDACRPITSRAPDVHVIVFTAADDADLRANAFAAGASAFVGKTCVDDLVTAVQHISVRPRVDVEPRDLSGRLIDGHHRERGRLSAELHDGIRPRVALLAAELAILRRQLAGSPFIVDQVDRLVAHTEELDSDLHRLSRDLHPARLEREGLPASIRRLCDELAHAHRLAIHLDVAEVPAGLASDVELCLYRITQEALHNVVKHSSATSVTVRLDVGLGELALDVVDDGRGFDPVAPRAGHGVGLISMQERARKLNGSATLTSAPGCGARVHVRVPLDRAVTGERRQ